MINEKLSRRQLLQGALAGLAAVPAVTLIARDASAVDTVPENDPMAMSIGYVTDASKVNTRTNPTYKPGQNCANCYQYKAAKPGASEGACTILGGRLVKANGWCKVWVPQSAAKPV
jgi:hypothetical protein